VYRHRVRREVVYGQFREFMEIAEALNDLTKQRGWTASTFWTPTVGAANEVIVETEYPDLASFQRENEAFYADAEVMNTLRRLSEHVVQGSMRDELLEEAPRVA
jgi:hypothetical protein